MYMWATCVYIYVTINKGYNENSLKLCTSVLIYKCALPLYFVKNKILFVHSIWPPYPYCQFTSSLFYSKNK